MSSDDWKEFIDDVEIEVDSNIWKIYEKRLRQPRKLSWNFTNDWSGLEFNPCIDVEIQIFDVSLISFYILPSNGMAGFQIFGFGMRWIW